jgi:hypothetical protein
MRRGREGAAEPGDVAEVGQDAQLHGRAVERAEPRHDEQQPQPGGRPEDEARPERAHERILRSVGSRPIRIISR